MEYTIHLGEDTLKQLDEMINGGGSEGDGEGGGSSDFSTAEVTVVFNNVPAGVLKGSFINSEDDILISECVFAGPLPTHTIVLYKGEQRIPFVDYEVVDYEGDVELVDDNLVITGNCKITLNKEEND